LAARLSALESENSDLVTRHTSLVTESEALRSDRSTLDSKLSTLKAEHSDLVTRHKSLVTAFENLEGLATRRLQDLAKLGAMVVEKAAAVDNLETLAAYCGENNFRIRRIEVLDSHEAPPHRHLNIVLHDVSLAGRHFDRLPVRLVEHHGRVGLVFLRPPHLQDLPLHSWLESGKDGDQTYMLVIPADSASRVLLQNACGSDQYFIRFLASALANALLNRHANCSPDGWEAVRVRKWLPVARALVQQLEQLPARLHYDNVSIAAGVQPGSWSFDLSNVFFAGRSMAHLLCEWKPAGRGGRSEILLHLTHTSAAPLLAWPHHDDHTPAIEVRVTLESAPWTTGRGAKFSALEISDQDFLRSLARELPSLAGKLAAEQGLSTKEKNRLLKSAQRAAAATMLRISC